MVIDRGLAGTRKNIINIEMVHKGGATLTIRVGRPAVMVDNGEMLTPA